jgi:uncharacterized LabA/DUF88 family protein
MRGLFICRATYESSGSDRWRHIANFANERSVDRIVLVTGDTDCVPAMKYARIAGLQIVLTEFDNHKLAPELLWHTDIKRNVGWPK